LCPAWSARLRKYNQFLNISGSIKTQVVQIGSITPLNPDVGASEPKMSAQVTPFPPQLHLTLVAAA